MKRAITEDLQAWLGKLASEANEATAKGDMSRVGTNATLEAVDFGWRATRVLAS